MDFLKGNIILILSKFAPPLCLFFHVFNLFSETDDEPNLMSLEKLDRGTPEIWPEKGTYLEKKCFKLITIKTME